MAGDAGPHTLARIFFVSNGKDGSTHISSRCRHPGTVPIWIDRALARATRPTIGFLASGAPETFVTVVAGFQKGLKAAGLAGGGNLSIEYRWAEARAPRDGVAVRRFASR
ncbi:hypothetical protein G8O24_16490 [Bradyrhizobium sp. INPA01-394B]|uniref:Uncharacterized protein n=1 Tax=Bradyrhizobium campsiandrae TaxID=1729892 RepID=A0ABR7U7D0_9BRAD|nr:hypothetical protein [Bradyrhizobium campsiandrae]MBC9878940.1 hypothetical protein [Bradyrhizobium campsiandrae]MBC9979713.1 hypothetical protein [Bradyrhizobium campsiandrae]